MKTTSNAVAVVPAAPAAGQAVIIRPLNVVRSMLVYGENSVQFAAGDHPTVDELALVVADDANSAESASVRAVNTLVLARMLPMVGKQSAFEYVKEKVRSQCRTESTYSNIVGLVACKDFATANNIEGSLFTIKGATGYLQKVGLIGDDGKLVKGAGKDPVVKALKSGTAQNAMRPVIDAAKAKRPDKFPITPKKSPNASSPTGNSSKLPESVELKGKDSVDKVVLDLTIIVGRVDKLESNGAREAFRKDAADVVRSLARLAGFDCVAIPPLHPPTVKTPSPSAIGSK